MTTATADFAKRLDQTAEDTEALLGQLLSDTLQPDEIARVVAEAQRAFHLSAVLLAVVSGALWGVFAVLTKGVVHLLGHGIEPLVRSPELYAWAAVAVAGTAWQQSSFRAGALTASLPTMTITEPLVASVLGVVVLGETLRPGEAGWAVLVAAIVALVASVVGLARTEATAPAAAI